MIAYKKSSLFCWKIKISKSFLEKLLVHFLAKYPEFDQDIISIIIARLQIILNDQIEVGLGTKLDPKDIKEIIYQELIERGTGK